MKPKIRRTAIWINVLILVMPFIHLHWNMIAHSWRHILPYLFNGIYFIVAQTWLICIIDVFDLPLQKRNNLQFRNKHHKKYRGKINQVKKAINLITLLCFVFTIIYLLIGTYIVLLNDLCFLILYSFVIYDSLKLYDGFDEIIKNDPPSTIPFHQK